MNFFNLVLIFHRTSFVYMGFNVLVLILSTTFFLIQFNNTNTLNSTVSIPELKPFTAVYDNAVENADAEETPTLTAITYAIIVVISLSTIAIQIYTASRLLRRHPSYVMCATALIVAIVALISPDYIVGRLLDTRIIGTFIVIALIFDCISITWVYGAKNIYTDLEFSIGRPISKLWVFLWCITPLMAVILLIWWSIDYPADDLIIFHVPRWLPTAISLGIIAILAFSEVYKQVDYNCFSMIREAGISSKDWGPADPIVRHAWKQYTSVCEDTGQKDFTLRRRGTREYTHSIKRTQCSHKVNSAYSVGNYNKSPTFGRISPNYTGSIFGDSAIEEDISIGNYQPYNQRMILSNSIADSQMHESIPKSTRNMHNDSRRKIVKHQQKEKQKIYVHPISSQPHLPTTIQHDKVRIMLNTLHRPSIIGLNSSASHEIDNYGSLRLLQNMNIKPSPSQLDNTNNTEHICWRKYTTSAEEFSTEL